MKISVQAMKCAIKRAQPADKKTNSTDGLVGPKTKYLKPTQYRCSGLEEVIHSAAVLPQIQICGRNHGSSRLYRFRLGIMTSCTRSAAAAACGRDIRRGLATAAAPRSRRAATQLILARSSSTGRRSCLVVEPLVVLLEAGHNAQVRLALRTMVFRFASQNASMPIDGVPAEVAAQRWSRPDDRTVTRTRILEGDDLPLGLPNIRIVSKWIFT